MSHEKRMGFFFIAVLNKSDCPRCWTIVVYFFCFCLLLFPFGSALNFLAENLLFFIKKKLFELSSQYEYFEVDSGIWGGFVAVIFCF